jgi:hypothetical protein
MAGLPLAGVMSLDGWSASLTSIKSAAGDVQNVGDIDTKAFQYHHEERACSEDMY